MLSLTVNRDVTATFAPVRVLPSVATLNVTNAGEFADDYPISIVTPTQVTACVHTCELQVPNGSSVQLVSEVRRSWTGGCVGEGPRCVLVVSGSVAITGTMITSEFANTFYGVNVSKSGDGGVKSKPSGIDCGPPSGCAAAFKRDIKVELTATAGQRSRFVRWRGDCGAAATATCSLRADSIKSAAAVFQLYRDELLVAKVGDGLGMVTSSPEGIDCGDVCRYTFVRGSNLRLVATPTAQSRFIGWQGPCTGAGVCVFTIDAPTTLSAQFMRKCAARTFTGVRIQAKRKPRRFVVHARLDSSAAVRLRLLRKSRTLAQTVIPNAVEGKQALVLKVPDSARAGPARLGVRVSDVCGGVKALSRSVRIP